MQSEASTGLYLDTRRPRKDGLFRVKLRVTFNRQTKYYSIPKFIFSEKDFEKIIGKKPRDEYKDIKDSLMEVEKNARQIIKDMPEFSFDAFERRYLNKGAQYKDVFKAFEYHIEQLRAQGRFNTLFTYQATLKNLKAFNKDPELLFTDIDAQYLKDFEKHLRTLKKRKLSVNTVSIYVRTIMHLFKLGIELNDIPQNAYPFGKNKYELPEHHNTKRALTKPDVLKIINHVCEEGSPKQYYRDLWAFSYLASGMNLNDIFRLKYDNIQGNEIVFQRKKIQHHRRTIEIKVFILPELKAIIDRWGQKPVMNDRFIMPLLTQGLTPEQEHKKIHQAIKMCNNYVREIANDEDIPIRLSTYVARHSFATILRNSGESIAYISEALGHADIKTTANYLDQFDTEKRENAAKKLL